MEFEETKLPFEKPIFYAFNAQARTGLLQAENEDHPLRIARVLQKSGFAADTVALAFLAFVPEAGYGPLTKRIGAEVVETARELSRHMRTGFAYIEEASTDAQAFAAANAIVILDKFSQQVDAVVRDNQAYAALGARGLQEKKRPTVPSLKFVNHIAKLKTGNDALDEMLLDKVTDFNGNIEDKLDTLGLNLLPQIEFTPFKDSGLLQDPKVERAYNAMMGDPRATRYSVNLALDTARLLGSSPSSGSSTAVAAALIDIGLSARNAEDVEFLQKRIDWDVMELIADHSVTRIRGAAEIMTAPVEFRQMAVASSIVTMTYALEEGKQAFEMLAQDDKPSPNAPYVKAHTLSVLKSRAQVSEALVGPAAGTVEWPELRAQFNAKLKELGDFVAANTPKPQLLLTGPAPATTAANDAGPAKNPKAKGVDL